MKWINISFNLISRPNRILTFFQLQLKTD